MLGNLVGGFVVILVSFSLFGTISQEVDNALNCNLTINGTMEKPLGSTDSFGGGGAGQFGGYDGEVRKSWASNYALKKTNASVMNPDCNEMSSSARTILGILPIFVVLAIMMAGIMIAVQSLSSVGLLGSGESL